jgi:hypothetical protein
MAAFAGKLQARRKRCEPLAGKSTLNRLEHVPAPEQANRYHKSAHEASLAYVMLESLRRIGLHGTALANATCASLRLKLLKIGAQVRTSVRRIHIAMASSHPHQHEWRLAQARLHPG